MDQSNASRSMRSRACRSILWFIDSFLAIVIFAPIVVGYWRGCWQLMDTYLLPENNQHSMWASLGIGLGSGMLFGLLQDVLTNRLHGPCIFLLFSRLYTIIYCVGCVNHWRGIWMVWDTYTGISWESGAASSGIGLLLLGLTRGLKNILAPPFVVVPDHKEHYFLVSTLFKTKKEQCCVFILDLFFTVVVTGSLVVFVWRGSWIFLDRKLFPNNPTFSAWGSLVIGITVTILAFFSQLIMIPCLRKVTKGFWKIILEDIYHTFCFVGAVNIWRGVWNLLNLYLYPDRPILSNLITTVGGNFILMIFFCANGTIPIRGADMDGCKDGSHDVVFRTSYFRSLFKIRKEKASERYKRWEQKQTISVDPSGYIDVSKSNGLMEGRGMGDGNSYSDGCSGEIQTDERKNLNTSSHNNEEVSLKSLNMDDSHLT